MEKETSENPQINFVVTVVISFPLVAYHRGNKLGAVIKAKR